MSEKPAFRAINEDHCLDTFLVLMMLCTGLKKRYLALGGVRGQTMIFCRAQRPDGSQAQEALRCISARSHGKFFLHRVSHDPRWSLAVQFGFQVWFNTSKHHSWAISCPNLDVKPGKLLQACLMQHVVHHPIKAGFVSQHHIGLHGCLPTVTHEVGVPRARQTGAN